MKTGSAWTIRRKKPQTDIQDHVAAPRKRSAADRAHANNAATYLVDDPTFGWLAYGGLLSGQEGDAKRVEPRDGARSRLFVAPVGLWITLDAGKIRSLTFDPRTGRIALRLDPADAHTPAARLFLESTTAGAHRYSPHAGRWERGGYTLPLGPAPLELELKPL